MKKMILFSKVVLAMIVWLSFSGKIMAQQEIDSEKYWIHDDFSSFDIAGSYIQMNFTYLLAPHDVELKTYYTNIEESDGTCFVQDKHLRIRGIENDGYAEFTVPDADIVTINIRAKSTTVNRIAYVYRNDELIATFEGLDRNHCVTFTDSIYSADAVTYKINGEAEDDATSPIIITSIIVEKYVTQSSTMHIISASAGEGGTVDPLGDTEVEEGQDFILTIIPDEGYAFLQLLLDSVEVTPDEDMTYTIPNVSKDYTIHATFSIIENIADFDLDLISIYPNPVENQLIIENNYTTIFDRIEIFNTIGQSILTQVVTHDNLQKIDVSMLPKGIYILHLFGDSQTASYKFVKK